LYNIFLYRKRNITDNSVVHHPLQQQPSLPRSSRSAVVPPNQTSQPSAPANVESDNPPPYSAIIGTDSAHFAPSANSINVLDNEKPPPYSELPYPTSYSSELPQNIIASGEIHSNPIVMDSAIGQSVSPQLGVSESPPSTRPAKLDIYQPII
ncbi:unnamed protein product, partial [Meganyctiphanes norvegica]